MVHIVLSIILAVMSHFSSPSVWIHVSTQRNLWLRCRSTFFSKDLLVYLADRVGEP